MFTDAIKTSTIPANKIIVVAPYISQYSYDRFGKDKGTLYNEWIFAETMEYWWKGKIVNLSSGSYNLDDESQRNIIFDMLKNYFPSPRRDSSGVIRQWGKNNFMYYFDHKIADYASSFPSIYHLGIIIPSGKVEKPSSNTHDDTRNSSGVCLKTTYLPFVANCLNPKPIMDDIDEKAKTNPEKLCVEPWYKKKYDENYGKKVLVLDFDETITQITIKDSEADSKPLSDIFVNKNEFKKILETAWKKLMPVYIVSRRQKEVLLKILNRFYAEEGITFLRIYDENILGRPNTFSYPSGIIESEKEEFWANLKVEYLKLIVELEKINKTDLLFCDDSLLNISKASSDGFKNSKKIDGTQNAKQVLTELNSFALSTNYKQKYLKYKKKYTKNKLLIY